MTTRTDGAVRRHLSTLFNLGVTRDLTDGQLLERFSTGPSAAAELAFEALVDRHGPMVLRVCRAQLPDPHDTHDAFQATFLILIKKTRSLWVKDSLGPWLHQVAFRTASCARAAAARRRKHEQRAAQLAPTAVGNTSVPVHDDWEQILHDEINRLPDRYRVPMILCDLQGHTCEEVARRMGYPVGTVKSWRSRARTRLRHRLITRGLAPSSAISTAFTANPALATLPDPTTHLALHTLTQGITAGTASSSINSLVKGVLQTMLYAKLQTAATALLASLLLTAGLGTTAWVVADDVNKNDVKPEVDQQSTPYFDRSRQIPAPPTNPVNDWPLTLRKAISIGLNHSSVIRVSSDSGENQPIQLSPIKTPTDLLELKSELMAQVRSIEQTYWSLAQAHEQVRVADKAVTRAEEILKREQDRLVVGRGTIADVAEIAQRLEQWNLELLTKRSDVVTTELQFRNLLGLPQRDARRIVPTTAPIEASFEPNWEKCQAIMLEKQPDILRVRTKLAQAETISNAGGVDAVERQKQWLQQVTYQTTNALARFFLEIDANYKQFKSASRLRAATGQRVDAQLAYYENGRITIDRFMDAMAQHISATAAEAQHKAAYNVAIIALEEAKGTLLDYDKITLVVDPSPKAVTVPVPSNGTPTAPSASPKQDPAAKTVSFDFTIGPKTNPFQLRGSFTITPAN